MRKNSARRFTVRAGTGFRTWRRTTVARLRGPDADRGASIVEYAGLLVIVALIVVAVRGLGLDALIAGAVTDAVNSVLGT